MFRLTTWFDYVHEIVQGRVITEFDFRSGSIFLSVLSREVNYVCNVPLIYSSGKPRNIILGNGVPTLSYHPQTQSNRFIFMYC